MFAERKHNEIRRKGANLSCQVDAKTLDQLGVYASGLVFPWRQAGTIYIEKKLK